MSKLMSQAGKPTGVVGRIFGYMMAWHNRPDNVWTLDLLGIAEQDSVLEVGFGPGQAIKLLSDANPSARVAGVDHSEAMLAAATRKNQGAIATGRVNLIRGSVESLPFSDASFDRAFCINCIYFWNEPLQGLRELQRVLRPGGRIAVTVRHKQRAAYQAFQPDRLVDLLVRSGFCSVNVHRNDAPSHPLCCATGTV